MNKNHGLYIKEPNLIYIVLLFTFLIASCKPTVRLVIPVGTTLEFTEPTITTSFTDTQYSQAVTKKTEVAEDKGAITYSSDNTDIAIVDAVSGEVTFVKAGIVIITATKAATVGKYKSSTASYTLTIEFAAGTSLSFAIKSIKKTFSEGGTYTHELTKNEVAGDNGAITYSSNDTDIANVDAISGEVTFIKAGIVIITVTKVATPDKYNLSTASYTLIIELEAGTSLSFATKSIKKTFSKGGTYTHELTKNEVTGDNGVITYSSDNTDIATVDAVSGEVTFVKAGIVIITATKAATAGKYKSSTASYMLIINHPDGSIIDYAQADVEVVFRYPFTYTQELIKTRDVADDEGIITYESDDETIATVNEKGEVTLRKVKKDDITRVTITATKAETPATGYLESSTRYMLTIKRFQPQTKADLVNEIREVTGPGAQGVNANLNYIDTSRITDMMTLFSGLADNPKTPIVEGYGFGSFTGTISKWDVSAVTTMVGMFNTSAFNGDISEWKVGNVESMTTMFQNNTQFNGDIAKWDVRKVVNMDSMFENATGFTQNIDCWADRINSEIRQWSSEDHGIRYWTGAHGMFFGRISHKHVLPSWWHKDPLPDPPDGCFINTIQP